MDIPTTPPALNAEEEEAEHEVEVPELFEPLI